MTGSFLSGRVNMILSAIGGFAVGVVLAFVLPVPLWGLTIGFAYNNPFGLLVVFGLVVAGLAYGIYLVRRSARRAD